MALLCQQECHEYLIIQGEKTVSQPTDDTEDGMTDFNYYYDNCLNNHIW